MVNEEIADILTQEANAVRNIPLDSDYEGATDLIIEYVHHRGGKLITSGMGKAGQIAMNMATIKIDICFIILELVNYCFLLSYNSLIFAVPASILSPALRACCTPFPIFSEMAANVCSTQA